MKYFLIIIILLFSTHSFADLIKPSSNLNAYDVVSIQLNALKQNDIPYKNYGIKQTWEFAHPKNRIFTGPLDRFIKMMYNDSYINILNHKEHNIEEIINSENIVFFNVQIIDINNNILGFKWIVEKVEIQGDYIDCWMTTSVSTPLKITEST